MTAPPPLPRLTAALTGPPATTSLHIHPLPSGGKSVRTVPRVEFPKKTNPTNGYHCPPAALLKLRGHRRRLCAMARLTTAPAPSPLVGVKREPDAEDLAFRTPASLPRKRRRQGGRKLVTPTLLPLSPLPTPQSIPSDSSVAVLTPPTAPVKRDPVGVDAEAAGKQGSRDLAPDARPAAAETSAASAGSSTSPRARTGGAMRPASSPPSYAPRRSLLALSRRPAACLW
jgi:hypothetical protein